MFDMRHIEVSVVARPGNTRAMERYRQELWPTKSRYERIFGVAAIVAALMALGAIAVLPKPFNPMTLADDVGRLWAALPTPNCP